MEREKKNEKTDSVCRDLHSHCHYLHETEQGKENASAGESLGRVPFQDKGHHDHHDERPLPRPAHPILFKC
jgi:hypothetical protein